MTDRERLDALLSATNAGRGFVDRAQDRELPTSGGAGTVVRHILAILATHPGLRLATPAFILAWRMVSGFTGSSLPMVAQERPEA